MDNNITGNKITDQAMILIPGKDKHAQIALMSYALSVRDDNFSLSNDIIAWLEDVEDIKKEPHEDNLVKLFDNQKQLMEVLGMSIDPVPDILDSPLFKDILICAVGEVAEALEPLAVATKPWKHAVDKNEVREHIKEEIVDVLFFVLELFIMAGMSPDDVVHLHTEKQKKNLIRAAGKSKSAEAAAGFLKQLEQAPYVHIREDNDTTRIVFHEEQANDYD